MENNMENDPFGFCSENCDEDNSDSLPTTFDMLKNILSTGKDVVSGIVLEGSLLSEKELYEKRMSICSTCPNFIKESSRCKICGCFMAKKAILEKSKCPINKW